MGYSSRNNEGCHNDNQPNLHPNADYFNYPSLPQQQNNPYL